MSLRLVGAGLGRTGTHSLKIALERLLGAPCYHMIEVFGHPEHVPIWQAAMEGEASDADLASVLDGYVATVDWPGCTMWRELSAANPDAVILLSQRDSADTWWKSANATILPALRSADDGPWGQMARAMMNRFTADYGSDEATKAAYEAHNAAVRAEAPPDRLVEWQPSDGWEPLCKALGVAVPDTPFPVTNTTEEWQARAAAAAAAEPPAT
jgi:hypothetical protein